MRFKHLLAVTVALCTILVGCSAAEDDIIPDYITIGGEQFSTALTELDIGGMGLTDEDIVPLRHMVNLTHLWLENNQISSISPLAELTNLRGLYLSGNQISDISPLVDLTNLTGLGLADNQISDISPLAELTNLQRLNLLRNPISDWSPVAHMEHVFGRP